MGEKGNVQDREKVGRYGRDGSGCRYGKKGIRREW